MRTEKQIEEIKNRIIDPYTVKDFLTVDDVNYLIDLFESPNTEINKTYKNTGPTTQDLPDIGVDPIADKLYEKIKREIGDFEFISKFFFWTDYPHIVHNDDSFELPDGIYRGITLPLKINGKGIPKLCFFDQFYFHGPAKFFNGSKDIPTYYNKQVYEYSQVDGCVENSNIDTSMFLKYFTHMNPQWLKGLSFHNAFDWIPGNAIIFDSVRLHCASDFRKQGIKSKLGISIFTKKSTA